MRYITLLFLSSLILFSCQRSEEKPTTVEAWTKLLTEKKKELNSVQKEITEIEEEIKKLDPEAGILRILVSLDTIKPSLFQRYVEIQSSVQSDDVVNVSSSIGGRVLRLAVKEGQNVRKGQLVASLDLEAVEKQIQELEVSLGLATTVFERQDRLWKQNIGSEIQYLEAKNNKERLEKSLESLRLQLSKGNVYAPISGVVDMEFTKQGEMAAPGQPIVQLLNTRQVKVVADVPENYLSSVRVGDQVNIELPAIGKEMSRKISLLGRSIDPANRTFKMEVNIPNSDGTIKPNLLGLVKFKDLEIKDALTVPLNVVQEEVNGNKFVFVASKDGKEYKATKKYISTGESYEGQVVIEEGLTENELLITDGSRNVSVGDLLNIQ